MRDEVPVLIEHIPVVFCLHHQHLRFGREDYQVYLIGSRDLVPLCEDFFLFVFGIRDCKRSYFHFDKFPF